MLEPWEISRVVKRGIGSSKMLRDKKKDPCLKLHKKLDRRSHMGMVFENEELRLRTIEINAELDHGHSQVKKLRKENERLKQEIWCLRDEYDKLEEGVKALGLNADEIKVEERGKQDEDEEGQCSETDGAARESSDGEETEELTHRITIGRRSLRKVSYCLEPVLEDGERASLVSDVMPSPSHAAHACENSISVQAQVERTSELEMASRGASPDPLPDPALYGLTDHFNLDQLLEIATSFETDRFNCQKCDESEDERPPDVPDVAGPHDPSSRQDTLPNDEFLVSAGLEVYDPDPRGPDILVSTAHIQLDAPSEAPSEHIVPDNELRNGIVAQQDGRESGDSETGFNNGDGFSTIKRRYTSVLCSTNGQILAHSNHLSVSNAANSTSVSSKRVVVSKTTSEDGITTNSLTFQTSSVIYMNDDIGPVPMGVPHPCLSHKRSESDASISSAVSVLPPRAPVIRLNSIEPNTVVFSVNEHPEFGSLSTQEVIDELDKQFKGHLKVVKGVRVVHPNIYVSFSQKEGLYKFLSSEFSLREVPMQLVDVSSDSIVISLSGVPHYVSDPTISLLLSTFGTLIGEVERRYYKGIDTGERFVRIKPKPNSKVPNFVTVGGCKILVDVLNGDHQVQVSPGKRFHTLKHRLKSTQSCLTHPDDSETDDSQKSRSGPSPIVVQPTNHPRYPHHHSSDGLTIQQVDTPRIGRAFDHHPLNKTKGILSSSDPHLNKNKRDSEISRSSLNTSVTPQDSPSLNRTTETSCSPSGSPRKSRDKTKKKDTSKKRKPLVNGILRQSSMSAMRKSSSESRSAKNLVRKFPVFSRSKSCDVPKPCKKGSASKVSSSDETSEPPLAKTKKKKDSKESKNGKDSKDKNATTSQKGTKKDKSKESNDLPWCGCWGNGCF